MSAAPAGVPAQLARDMAKVNDLFNTEVIGKRNFVALDQIYTGDARILPPGAPMITGREAIRTFWRNLAESVNAMSAVLTSVDVIPAGEGVVEIGKATITARAQGQATASMDVKYVVYWRQENGQWKWHVDIWNADA